MDGRGGLLAQTHASSYEIRTFTEEPRQKKNQKTIAIVAISLVTAGCVIFLCGCCAVFALILFVTFYRNSWSGPKITVQYKNVPGIDPNYLSLDIYNTSATPTQNLRPVAIWVHGGGWVIGDKKNKMENKFSLFQSLNYILVSVNYRLSPNPAELSNSNRIKYPIHNLDVADAIQWVKNNIIFYGGNPEKLVLLGHSAGAHLVSLSGTSPLFLPPRQVTVQCVASFDTEGYDVTQQSSETLYLNAFGSDSSIWTEASPFFNIVSNRSYPKFFVAKRGTDSRIALADAFINKLLSVGTVVTQITASQYDHEGINDAIGAPGETIVTNPLKQFLSICFP